jgi:glycosyltransferase involved in cell wall biosynthesis
LPELKRLATDLGVEGCCDFQGHVSRQQVLHDVSRACLSVLPTRAEAASYVLIESLAFGTPIVASKVGGIPEIVRDGVDGYLVPPDDPETLAGTLVKLLGNPALRERLGQNSRQRFLECYELSKVVIDQANWLETLSIN